MTSGTLVLILISVTLSACAQVLFKMGVAPVPGQGAAGSPSLIGTVIATLLRPGVLGGLTLYGIGTVIWLRALARTELSQAYPFVGLGFVMTAALGYVVFDEVLGPTRLVGIALVIAGVILVGRS
jgi:multidrug transporter EmrE-like cation transporter